MSADLDARDRYGLPPRADTPQMSPLACELTRLRELNDELIAAIAGFFSAEREWDSAIQTLDDVQIHDSSIAFYEAKKQMMHIFQKAKPKQP